MPMIKNQLRKLVAESTQRPYPALRMVERNRQKWFEMVFQYLNFD